MKIIFRTAALAALVIIASCGKDSADDTAQQQQQEAEQLEQTPLEANTVSDNLLISGGTKMDGMPPAPSGTLSFDASGTSKSAFLGEGFDVTMSSDSPIVGAYIQIKAEDGTAADSYYDVNIDTNSLDNKSSVKNNKRSSGSALSKKEDEISLDVDFTTEIKPGKFCSEICVYDEQGNVSTPQEICITVESWGGNAKVIGTWNLVKEVQVVNDESEASVPGDEECAVATTIICANENTINADKYCYITESYTLVFNEDGTFESIAEDTEKRLDLQASQDACDKVYTVYDNKFTDKGKWAYLKDEEKFVLIINEWTEVYEGETDSATYADGDGEFYLEDENGLRFEGNALVFGVDEGFSDSYKAFFEK